MDLLFGHIIPFCLPFLFLGLLFFAYKLIRERKIQLSKKEIIILAIIIILSSAARLYFSHIPDKSNNVTWKGQFLAKLLIENGIAYPGVQEGHAFLLSISYFLFGYTDHATQLVGIIISALSQIMLYIFAKSITKQKTIGFIAAAFLGVLPQHMLLSAQSAYEITNGFAVIYMLFMLTLLNDKNKTSKEAFSISMLILLGTLFFPIVKLDNIALLPLACIAAYLMWTHAKQKQNIAPRRAAQVMSIALILAIIIMSGFLFVHKETRLSINNTLGITVFTEEIDIEHEVSLFENTTVFEKAGEYIHVFFSTDVHPLLFLILFWIGFASFYTAQYAKKKIFNFVLLIPILCYSSIYIIFHTNYYDRYITSLAPLISFFAAYGLWKIGGLIKQKQVRTIVFVAVIILLSYQGLANRDLRYTDTDVKDLLNQKEVWDSNSIMIHCNKGVHYFYDTFDGKLDTEFEEHKTVYLVVPDNYACNITERFGDGFEAHLHKKTEHNTIYILEKII